MCHTKQQFTWNVYGVALDAGRLVSPPWEWDKPLSFCVTDEPEWSSLVLVDISSSPIGKPSSAPIPSNEVLKG